MISVRETDFQDIKDEWMALEKEGHLPTVFQAYDWMETWWQHYGRGRRKLLLVAYDGNALVGIAPLVIDSLSLKNRIKVFNVIRIMGNRESSYSDFIFRKRHLTFALPAISRYLMEHYGSHILYLSDMRETALSDHRALFLNLYKVIVKDAFSCPVIYFPSTWDEYWNALSKTTKKNLKWYKNKLSRNGQYSIEYINCYVEKDANDLFRLHYQRWGMNPDDPSLKRLEEFERDLMKMLSKKKYLRLMFLNYQGERIAALLQYDYEEKRYFHKGGYNPAFKDMSPGTVLILESIRNAFDLGLKCFDFLRGEESYKSHFTKDKIQCFNYIAANNYIRAKLFDLLLKL